MSLELRRPGSVGGALSDGARVSMKVLPVSDSEARGGGFLGVVLVEALPFSSEDGR